LQKAFLTRYSLFRLGKDAPEYLMAAYEPECSGLTFTGNKDDACHYVTIEKACSVARQIKSLRGYEVFIGMVG